jgi:hypothetical protein
VPLIISLTHTPIYSHTLTVGFVKIPIKAVFLCLWVFLEVWIQLQNFNWNEVRFIYSQCQRSSREFVTHICILTVQAFNLELQINHLKTKRRLFYLKTQFVPRSKHFSFRLYKPISYVVWGKSRCLFWDIHTTHKYSVVKMYNSWMFNLLVHHVTSRL